MALAATDGISSPSSSSLHEPGAELLAPVREEEELEQNVGAAGESEAPVILITTVDIGNGKSENIELRKGGDPTMAARTFCEKHGLPPYIVPPLTQHILDNLSKAKLEEGSRKEDEGAGAVTSPPPELSPQHVDPQLALLYQQQALSETSTDTRQKMSFANGMNERLYEQLNNKLMPVTDAERIGTVSGANRHLLTNARNSNRPNSAASSDAGQFSPSRDTVHSRLYHSANELKAKQEMRRKALEQEKQASIANSRSSMSWISQEMMRSRSHGPFQNYGDMLYAEGVEGAAIRAAKAAAERAERERAELEQLKPQPAVSKLAKALWSGSEVNAQAAQACWQRLSQDKRAKTLVAVREMQGSREMAELRECTFKPQVNATSAALMADRSETLQMLRMSAHEQLYQDSQRRQQKRDELAGWLPEEVTFKPKVNEKSAAAVLRQSYERMQELAKSPDKAKSPGKEGGAPSVAERLFVLHEQKLQKQEERRKNFGKSDPETGKPFYRPEVGRPPKNSQRNPNGAAGIGEHLYSVGLEAERRKAAALEVEAQADKAAKAVRPTTATSAKLFQRLKAKRFHQIFEYLDEARVGLLDLVALVRSSTEHMGNLDIEVREDVELAAEAHAHACKVPLLPSEAVLATASPEEQQKAVAALPPAPPVDLQAFSTLMEGALLRKRKPRAYLVPSPTSKTVPAPTFKPAINPKSKKLASRLRPVELSPYDILHYNAEAVRTKHEALRKACKDDDVRGCTFRPALNRPVVCGRPVEGRALRNAGTSVASSTAVRRSGEGVQLEDKAQRLAAMREYGPASGDELAQYMALEAEVEQALAGVGAEASPSPSRPLKQQQAGGAPSIAEVLKARIGEEVDPNDLQATEELLMGMLGQATASPAPQGLVDAHRADIKPGQEGAIKTELMQALQPGSGKTDEEVLVHLQRYLASSQMQLERGEAAAAAQRAADAEGGAAQESDASPQQKGATSATSATTLEDLASSLAQWDQWAPVGREPR